MMLILPTPQVPLPVRFSLPADTRANQIKCRLKCVTLGIGSTRAAFRPLRAFPFRSIQVLCVSHLAKWAGPRA